MRFRLPFLYAVHYVFRGKTVTYENLPWKIVLARTGNDAIAKFHKRYPRYRPVHVIKI
jgi:hypothetical protein